MTVHVLTGQEVTTGRRKPSDLVAEYEAKRAALPEALVTFNAAGDALKMAATVGGEWGYRNIDTGRIMERELEKALLGSAWRYVYKLYNLAIFASAKDKDRLERMFSDPEPFTIEKLREWFGAYIADPRGSILRGLAEVFSDLDLAYRSHEKVKIGVKGLPKRIILSGIGSTYGSHGKNRLEAVLNALAAYQGKPMLTHHEMSALMHDGDALREDKDVPDPFQSRHERERDPRTVKVVGRGVWLKRFQNGNGHLFFGTEALRDINLALAEYYGEVLADTPDENPTRRIGTAVAKDLQYYPTPTAVIDRVIGELFRLEGKRVLEPSCGDGRFLDALRKKGARTLGIEVDVGRAALARSKGHSVVTANFLEVSPSQDFDEVVMNPPFYGKHYAKHVRHALKFLKPKGKLTAILPVTARYDHGLLDDLAPRWNDLPIGSFSESGTNINTTVATVFARAS